MSVTIGDRLSDGRCNNVNLLRLLFAWAVIYSHAYDLSGIPGEAVRTITRGAMAASGFAVQGFFVLSGLLVSQSWHRSPGIRAFTRKRALRILPGFFTCILVCVIVFAPAGATTLSAYLHERSVLKFIAQAIGGGSTGIRGIYLTNPVPANLNGSLWTIRIEIICYGLVAVLGLMRALEWWVCMPAFLAVLLILDLPPQSAHVLVHQLLAGLAPFLVGISLFAMRDSLLLSPIWAMGAAGLVGAGVAFSRPEMMLFGWSYLVVFLGFTRPLPGTRWTETIDLSYGYYLYGFPIEQTLIYFLPAQVRPSPVALAFIAAIACAPFAVLSWFLIERPWLRRKSGQRDRNVSQPGASLDAPARSSTHSRSPEVACAQTLAAAVIPDNQ